MDIHITGVPQETNRVELKFFLTASANQCDILAFDVFKQVRKPWANITVPCEKKGRRFLEKHGGYNPRTRLFFKNRMLRFERGKTTPDPISVEALKRHDADMRVKRSQEQPISRPKPAGSSINFNSLHTGVWKYSREGRPVFDEKHNDCRKSQGNKIVFGRHALAVQLDENLHASTWAARIDISYDTLEHVIVSNGDNKRGILILTLRSPPKIYSVRNPDDLLVVLLGITSGNKKPPRMMRERSLSPELEKNTALCMVYRFILPDTETANLTMEYINRIPTMPNALSFKILDQDRTKNSIEMEYEEMSNLLDMRKPEPFPYFTFSVRFQLLALVLEGTLTPSTITSCIPFVIEICQDHSSEPELVARGIRMLQSQIPTPGPYVEAHEFNAMNIVGRIRANIKECLALGYQQWKPSHLVTTYQATVTPTGLLLHGPENSISNRVLRRYAGRSEYFLRVSFAEEDGTPIRWDPRASLDAIYYRFKKALLEGVRIAGRLFTFLGFSHSSLRDHTAWFMAPFTPVGSSIEISSKDVIENLGDFSHIQCSAKCAARIGQAFSDTIHAVPILDDVFVIEDFPDIERNRRCFSDGCGLISKQLLEHVWSRLPYQRRLRRPTILQIRYRGAKGIVSLDSTLSGKKLLIRKSMTKYTAKAMWNDLEICDANYRPLRAFLNQQYIKILEDLGVPAENFKSMQQEELDKLTWSMTNGINAAAFLEYSQSGCAAGIPSLFVHLHYIGLNYHADRFLTDIVEVAIMTAVRDMKYRARIPIEKGYLLFGTVDHTNELKEGEVYVTIADFDEDGYWKSTVITGQMVVSRSPALHPGDIQVVKGVNVSKNSPLRQLSNCVVFSQQGQRDLPSQLSGGDLDGDTYLVTHDQRLFPARTYTPANYPPTPAKDLGRPVQVQDIAEFFVDFMKADRLGQICNMHKVRADKYAEGTLHRECIQLASLASDAVDFSKSGNPVDITKVPKGKDYLKPDWMAPGSVLVMSKEGATELEEDEADDPDDPDAVSALDPERMAPRYYKSDKVLGELYRNIDQAKVLAALRRTLGHFQDHLHGTSKPSLLMLVEEYIDRETKGIEWKHHIRFATEIREYYEENLYEIMQSYRMNRDKPLTELEVFSGNILAKKERAASQFFREANKEIRDRFDQDVSSITRRMVRGDWNEDDDGGFRAEALPRTIACFKVSMEAHGWPRNRRSVYLKSWKYVAASVCLEQLKLYHTRLAPW